MARRNVYTHSMDLQEVSISNMEWKLFAQHIVDLPYRGYEVEQCKNGLKIVVTKPGGKTVYGILKKEDISWQPYKELLESL